MYLGVLFLVSLYSVFVSAGVVSLPPRGWNSYDSFWKAVNESEFIDNAYQFAKLLSPAGYDTMTIDYYWYSSVDLSKTYIDEYGRPQPDPVKWPSSQNGQGFKPLASYLSSLGIHFGIHIMRGISDAALKANSPILNSEYYAQDIVAYPLNASVCNWSFQQSQFYALNFTHPGAQLFFDSLVNQYAEWGVDFIKNDCVFGDFLSEDHIIGLSNSISKSSNPSMALSLSPGFNDVASSAESSIKTIKQISKYVDLFRCTADLWDDWESSAGNVHKHFNVTKALSSLLKTPLVGKHGSSYMDMDMLPFGWIGDGQTDNPYHTSRLSYDTQRLVVTLWALFHSPLIYGGDLRSVDSESIDIVTNPDMLLIQKSSVNNTLIYQDQHKAAWRCDVPEVGSYVALFNQDLVLSSLSVDMVIASNGFNECNLYDVWAKEDLGKVEGAVSGIVPIHGTVLIKLTNCSNTFQTLP